MSLCIMLGFPYTDFSITLFEVCIMCDVVVCSIQDSRGKMKLHELPIGLDHKKNY